MAGIDPDVLWDETKLLARDGAFEKIAATLLAIALVDAPRARQFARKLFLRVVNHYPPFLVDIGAWREWIKRSNWRRAFTRAAFDPRRLRAVVEGALEDFRVYRAANADAVRLLASDIADILDSVLVRRENAHSAFGKLMAMRDTWVAECRSSAATPLFSGALSAIGMVKTTGADSAASDPWLTRVLTLKQELRVLAA